MNIGDRIAHVRESKDVLQKDLAKAIKIDPVVLNRIEKNKRPIRAEELKAIANYFDVSTDYLLDNETKKSKPVINEKQNKLIAEYAALNDEGQHTLWNILSSLKLSHARNANPVVAQTSRLKESILPTEGITVVSNTLPLFKEGSKKAKVKASVKNKF